MEHYLQNSTCLFSSASASVPFILLLALFTGAVVLAATRKNKTSPPPHNLPPGPWKLPIIGNLHQLEGPVPTHRRLRDMAKDHGPVMRLQLGELPHVIVSSAAAAKDVLKTHDAALASRPYLLAADILFYGRKGITFTPSGEYWRRMRKICTAELLSTRRVLSYRTIREDELSGNLVQRISASAGRVVNLGETLFWASNRVIARSAFGVVKENAESFMDVVNSISDQLGGLAVSDLYPSVKFLPALTGFRAELTRLHREADGLLEEIINEHKEKRRQLNKGEYSREQVDSTENLVDVLLDLQENCTDVESPLTIENIKAVATELLLAGSGTSPVTIEWTMSEIMSNPRVLAKVQEEVRRAFCGKGKVSEEGLDDLVYLDAVIKEALRLHPDGPLLAPRESQEDVVVGGYLVPARTKVMVNVWAIGRDESSWDDADTFYPERFLDCAVDYKGKDFEFLPFGAGRRMCAGISFGMGIVKLGLANLLYHFDWELPAGMKSSDLDMTERFGLTLRRNCPLCLIPIAYNFVS
ncbi:unnamed protein product [Linum trigynum]|uniref:Cytochrome P450 n=1 Tax=Linum trigynum TaxID=586398 RepID=A0AAV2F485_9ROSI